jgi:hypothetical protein
VDSASANLEREIRRWRGKEEGAPDTWSHGVSDGHGDAGARASQAAGWARPKWGRGKGREAGHALERRAGRCRAASWAGLGRDARLLGQKPNRRRFLFLFPFPIFQSIFQKDFEFPFEFNSNHSIQKFKCSSINAQTCS